MSCPISTRRGTIAYDEEEEHVLHDACGVIGVVSSNLQETEVSSLLCLGMVALQHRGQESAGMATTNGTSLNKHKGMGMVSNIFSEEELKRLAGVAGIGHTRYSTSGVSELVNCQPFIVDSVHGRIALAHNGELVNAGKLRQDVMSRGVGLTSQSDSELILQLLTVKPDKEEGSKPDWPARICHFMSLSQTSYSFVIMVGEEVYAVRDPFGNRPLCLGQVCAPGEDGEDSVSGWVVASESCAFLSMGASYLREVLPGEIVCLRRSGMKTECIVDRPCIPGSNDRKPPAFCIFEYVYFSRADTVHEGQQVYSARFRCGRRLAIEAPVEADIVSTVPESATPAAMGFADQLGLNYVEVLTKNRYVGRTFILPSMRLRRTGVTKKFGLLQENFRGKRVVLVDDSIVRGTTIGNIVRLLKSKGAKEVHVRVASPPLKYPCFMGINIPTHNELIANSKNADQLAESLGADSLVYLSIDGLKTTIQSGVRKEGASGHCMACLNEDYPVSLDF
ncbi:amidophosphoribosyltransferase-like [Sycon ciliatum]|uniref:amidophosphoribosyltransferase-like n=1 Tax=Sycon ciliatum TaxID=27933 RepID=UPI0020AACFF5|eukprot:scpid33462/ scgid21905/ Amidophosphoribosyltransferase; Glutamine phosphoribosylpyrophosphate amidotransferase